MANHSPIPPPYQNTCFTADRQPKRVNLLSDARDAEQVVIARIRRPKISNDDLSSLVRALCQLFEAIRVLRGIPSPGQLRPDLDPQQLQKALKRARSRKPMIDIATGPFELPSEAPISTPAKRLPQTEQGKDSLGLTAPTKPPKVNKDPPQQTIATTEQTTDPEPQDEGKGIS